MLTKYLKTALQHARYEMLEEDQQFYGEIPECNGVHATANTLEACREQLEEVLAIALTHAEIHPDTLVIVTADHAQAAQIVPEPSLFEQIPVPIFSPGHVARLNMADGSLMTINYATNTFRAEEHTGANVPLFANQPGAGRVPSYLRQREVYDVMMDYLGLEQP